jgi:Tfp pilus tip-associated adhesin PilY1
MKFRIIPQFAMASQLFLCSLVWPVASGIGDLDEPRQEARLTSESRGAKRLAMRLHTGLSHTADGIAVRAIDRSDHLVLYQGRYHPDDRSGDVVAYLGRWENGRLVLDSRQWRAADQFQFPGLDWRRRRIVTYGGSGIEGRGVPFHWDDLSLQQQSRLLGQPQGESVDSLTGRQLVAYLRGERSARFRQRNSQLGDIVNSVPVLCGRTLFVGANDGMLHAFDAFTGRERFAYVPNLVLENLRKLGSSDYAREPRSYVDAAPTVGHVLATSRQRHTYLVGGLGRGGRGYYCLLLDVAERKPPVVKTALSRRDPMIDQYGDGTSEEAISRIVQWEYPAVDTANDATDNDGDGIEDEPGETDPHLGYSFGQAYAVNANAPSGSYRPVVIFGNGYDSADGEAVLYILEARNGRILRKINTGAGGRNGLSTPALIDVDLDRRIDYAYAGDLQGNLWKFDLTADDPERWGVASAAGSGSSLQPLFQAPGLSISGRPDVMAVNPACDPETSGVMVVFGTGAYTGFGPVRTRPNAIFGVLDNGGLESAASWSVELSSLYLTSGRSGERITRSVTIRGGLAVVTSYTPGRFPGPAHGAGSRVHVLDACTGSAVRDAHGLFDYPLLFFSGISSNPVILKNPSQPHIDHLLAWDPAGGIIQATFAGERQGRVYWRQNFE